MAYSLSSNAATAAAGPVTRPGYLIELHLPLSGVARITTFGDVTWNGYAWAGADVKVQGLTNDAEVAINATLVFGNTDSAWSSIAYGADDLRDAQIVIYEAFADALANFADAVKKFDGVGDEITMANPPQLTVKLVGARTSVARGPRRRIAPPLFNALQPVGTQVSIGNVIYMLGRTPQ